MGLRQLDHYIDGQMSPGHSGRTRDVFNPATGTVTARVAMGAAAEVDQTVAGADFSMPTVS